MSNHSDFVLSHHQVRRGDSGPGDSGLGDRARGDRTRGDRTRGDRTRLGVLLHGALGSSQNLRALARELAEARTDYTFVVADLRGHGGSRPAPPPHDLHACALDLIRLAEHLGRQPDVVLGHSLGGKVALEYAQLLEHQQTGTLRTVWALDANPGPQPISQEVTRVVQAVRAVGEPLENRGQAIGRLLERGLPKSLATWLATNLRREGDVYRWSLELDVIEQLLSTYSRQDYWPYLAESRQSPEIHLVIAEETDRLDPERRLRAEALPKMAACRCHVLEKAGHWLHVDNPLGLRDLILKHL